MKQTPFLLTFGLLLVAIGGYFLYDYYFKHKAVSSWELIPEQTVLVYEVGECGDCFDNIKDSAPWQIYNSIVFQFAQDSIQKGFDFLKTPKKGELISMHVTSKDAFDFVFYIPSKQLSGFASQLDKWRNLKGAKYSEREFNGSKIHELKIEKRIFSWTSLDELWIASFTPFLVEDVIRTFTSGVKSNFMEQVAEVYQLPSIKNDAGNLYIHLNNFVNWLTIFTESSSQELLPVGQASLLDVKQSGSGFTLNGFSLVKKNNEAGSLLSILEGQTPVQFSIKQYISERTLVGLNFGISDGAQLFKKLNIVQNQRTRDSLLSLAKTDLLSLYAGLGPEMAVSYVEGRSGSVSKVFLFQSKNTDQWLSFFDQISKAVELEDTVFYEKYATYEIREIEMKNFSGKLFSPIVSGFDVSYYTWIGNTIIMADQVEILKSFLSDIDHEEVWGKSVSFNKFLESTLLESSVSFYINTPLVWSSLSKKLNPRWQQFVLENQDVLRAFDMGAIQFSNLNESFYTNATWSYGAVKHSGLRKSSSLTQGIVTNIDVPLLTEPFIIRNHASKQDEIIVQDSLFNVYQISADGKVLWKLSLEGPISGDINQVDFYNNGKLQIFFATDKRLHVIDRLGKYVTPFPVSVPTKRITFSSLVDYDNSKKYRFLVADEGGNLWMYDKDGKSLEGWTPRDIDGSLSASARHYRIRGKDFIIAIKKDGRAYLMNRRGENIKGFPLNLDSRPDGDYYLETGNSFSTSYFVCVSRDGFRVKFNLEGKIVSKETLIKPSIETKFSLVEEQKGKSYLISRQDTKRIVLLDENLKELVTNEYLGSNPVSIHYNDFGSGHIFISITDLVQSLSYIYDGKGKLLTTVPIESTGVAIRPLTSSESRVFTVFEKTLSIQSISN